MMAGSYVSLVAQPQPKGDCLVPGIHNDFLKI